MDKRTYFLAVYETDGVYTGQFADFECVFDQGDTLEELIANARELLNFTVAYMVEHKEALPEASSGKAFKDKLESERQGKDWWIWLKGQNETANSL